jgi:hypothetical protein
MELPIEVTEITHHDKERGIALIKTDKPLVLGEDYVVVDSHHYVNFNYKWRCVKDADGLYRMISHQIEHQLFEMYLMSTRATIQHREEQEKLANAQE